MTREQEPDDIFFHGNFMEMDVQKVEAVIGNPPYVRLRDLPSNEARLAIDVASGILQERVPESASLWMPFILRSLDFLLPKGRMALVLPSELLHVKYARPLWSTLGERFGALTVVRVRERIFPEILQDVIILLCDEYGGGTACVNFNVYERLQDYLGSDGRGGVSVRIEEIVSGGRPFSEALLHGNEWLHVANKVHMVKVADVCRFNVGYVSGDKKFFHPNSDLVSDFGIRSRSLVKSVSTSRALRGAGLLTSDISRGKLSNLFYPVNGISAGERHYISSGIESGVANRYKCRVRDPWYVVPGVKVPDIVLNSFASVPSPLINDAGLVVSNSLLGGYLAPGIDARDFCGSWYNSLTLLFCEQQIHSLGGGVMVLIPGEVSNVRLPFVSGISEEVLNVISKCLREGDIDSAYRAGDKLILMDLLGLTLQDVEEIRLAVATLRSWRLN